MGGHGLEYEHGFRMMSTLKTGIDAVTLEQMEYSDSFKIRRGKFEIEWINPV